MDGASGLSGRGPERKTERVAGRHSLRLESRDLPHSRSAIVARTGGHRQWAGLPLAQSPRPSTAGPVITYRRCARREETRDACGARSGKVRRALTQGGPCELCGHLGGIVAIHNESDRPSERADGAAVHPGWQHVPREQRWKFGFVAPGPGTELIQFFPDKA